MGRHSPGTPSRLQGQQGLGLRFGQEAQCLLLGPVDPAPPGSPENRGKGSGKIAKVVLTDRGLSSCLALSWVNSAVLATLCPSPQQPEGHLSQGTHIPLLTTLHSFQLTHEMGNPPDSPQPCTTCPITSCPLCLLLTPSLPSFQPHRSHRFLQHAAHTPAPGPLHMLFPLPGTLFPSIPTWLLPQVSASISPSQEAFLEQLISAAHSLLPLLCAIHATDSLSPQLQEKGGF